MTDTAEKFDRYFVDSDDDFEYLVMDGGNLFPVAVCHCDMDSTANEHQAAADARVRANKIAQALNEIRFDWKPPT